MSTTVIRRQSVRRSGVNFAQELQALTTEVQEIEEKQSFKIAVVGNRNSGKSCIVQQYCMNQFVSDHEETIEDVYDKVSEITLKSDLLQTKNGGKKITCTLKIGDTGDKTILNEFSKELISQCSGILLVFSVTDQDSYSALMDFYDQIQQMRQSTPVVVVANKCDLHAEISDVAIQMVAAACNAPFIKVSAATRTNIDEAFEELINEILVRQYIAVPLGLDGIGSPSDEGTDVKKKRNTLSQRLSRVFKKN
jgi:small GTP-binding protein